MLYSHKPEKDRRGSVGRCHDGPPLFPAPLAKKLPLLESDGKR